MTMLPDDRIPGIVARVDLVALVEGYAGPATSQSGGRHTFRCPSPDHPDHHPSFTVAEGRWRCWSACNEGGDAIDLLVWLDGCTKAEAIDRLARDVGLERQHQPRPGLEPAKAERVLGRFLEERGWRHETARELGLRVVLDMPGRPRVRFPFRLGDRMAYWQDRATSPEVRPKWLSPKGGSPILYEANRLNHAREVGYVFVVEGVTDAVAVIDTYENPAVVGVPGVGAWRHPWVEAFGGLAVYVVADNDPAGERLRSTLGRQLAPVASAVWQVPVPEEHHDLADWRTAVGPEQFDRELMAAVDALSGAGREAVTAA